ncbi:MAG: ABC transporter ATP-binding protein [Verrucomicrobia bacterium]|nr:ABC transporter ATP-binding protein [Verrucomicrobiota bacterium]
MRAGHPFSGRQGPAFGLWHRRLVFVVRGIAQFFASFLINLAGLRVVESVRLAVFEKLQTLHLGFFGKIPTGDLMQRLTGDVQSVRLVLVDVSTDLIIQPFTLVGALAVAWFGLSVRLCNLVRPAPFPVRLG